MRRGEIWTLNLDPTVGAEIKKTRPVVIISSDNIGVLPLRVIVPITEWKDRYRISDWMVRIQPSSTNGLEKDSCADCLQIRSVSTDRFVRRMGYIIDREIEQICAAVSLVIEAD